jgi:transcriptional/translational regulatory protein YebC/TACO1
MTMSDAKTAAKNYTKAVQAVTTSLRDLARAHREETAALGAPGYEGTLPLEFTIAVDALTMATARLAPDVQMAMGKVLGEAGRAIQLLGLVAAAGRGEVIPSDETVMDAVEKNRAELIQESIDGVPGFVKQRTAPAPSGMN